MPFIGWLLARDQLYPSFLTRLIDPKVAAWVGET